MRSTNQSRHTGSSRPISDRVLFLDINCRDIHSARAVIGQAAKQVVTGLLELRALGLIVKDALVEIAKILVALTGFDDVELKGVHEHIEQFKSAIQLGGRQSFLKCLTASFSISLERSEKTVESMTGKVKFDVARLAEAINALFEDISEQGYDVVLYLDNLDELHHEYRNAAARDAVRNDVAALLSLRKSPIVLVVNVRTYSAAF